MFVYFWSVYILAIEFETSGGRVLSRLKGLFSGISNIRQVLLKKPQKNKQSLFVLFWISVHSCNRIWNMLMPNLPRKQRIHCEIACLRLLNVFCSSNFAQVCNYDCTEYFNTHHLQFIVCIRVDYLHPIVGVFALLCLKMCFWDGAQAKL